MHINPKFQAFSCNQITKNENNIFFVFFIFIRHSFQQQDNDDREDYDVHMKRHKIYRTMSNA